MKTAEAEQWLKQQLISVYETSEAANIADLVLEKITGFKRSDRRTRQDEPLATEQIHQLTQIEQRLQQHEPVQYILGEAYFFGLKLYVDKNVLVPRPETEELVEWVIQDVKESGKEVFERRPNEADETTKLKILDVGTGSGCIALALKAAMPKAEVWACDTSDEALTVARRNGADLDIRVDFVGLNFLDDAQTRQLPTVDIIVSNPPYIPVKDKDTMRPNVVAHEPHTALFVPNNNALIFYEALAQFGHKRLYDNGAIYAEIYEDLGKAVVDLFEQHGYKNVQLKKDMQGKDRMVKAEKIVNSE
jgi:release factor glutamine methyltransferase